MKRLNLALAAALVGLAASGLACSDAETTAPEAPVAAPAAEPAPAEPAAEPAAEAPPADTQAGAPAARPKFVPPVKGVAEIGYLKPVTKVVDNVVVTTIRIKNLSNGAIAGLRLDEFWWDAQGNPLPGDSQRLKKPLMPGEEVTLELRVPRNPKMNRNNYNFSHANGQIKAKLLARLD